ncbi:MAG: NAD-dependent DNA ligase LigA [Candidatus Shapirobacteria bacterium]|jgi:DNA ligase (NAD+)
MITLDTLDLQHLSPQDLGELLISAKNAYYTTGKPIMDDHTYDTLEEILRQKNPHHRIFQKVGNKNFDTGFLKKSHSMPMGSQNKVTTAAELVHYFELKKIAGGNVDMQSISYVVQPKIDGISLEIEYKDGNLIDAITRGDGFIGDVITQNVVRMQNFRERLNEDFTGTIRCEIVVTYKDFKKLNKIVEKNNTPSHFQGEGGGGVSYSNPRNAVSGISQRLDGKFSELCSLIAVDISPEPALESEKITKLKSLGFIPVETHLCQNFNQIEQIYQQFLTKTRKTYPFEIDGLIVKINNLKIAHHLGSKNNRPKFQIAYKFPAESNQTQIKKIEWQVGPLGTITPVGQVEPIELTGAVITFASLGNYDLVIQKNINIGDIVEISRRGDVIPHVEKIITKVNPGHVDIPILCPSCQTKLIKEDKFLRCPNPKNCLAQILGSLRLFCDTLGILGLSDKTIAKLYQADKIRLPGDFYKLTIGDISNLVNLGEKSGKNIIYQIQTKKNLTLKQVFDAAIIPNFSAARIQQLITAGFNTPEKLLNISKVEIESLPGFQKTLAEKIQAGIELRKEWLKSILSQVQITNHQLPVTNYRLQGLAFAITGDLSQPRKKIEDLIEQNGGSVSSSVSKNTSYLITNETKSNSSKFLAAKKFGTKIITETKFLELINS